MPARVGWVVMESPAPLLFAILYARGEHRAELVPLVLLAMWQTHYLYRAFGYPFLMRDGRRMPLALMLMAIAFNVLTAFVNATWVYAWATTPATG